MATIRPDNFADTFFEQLFDRAGLVLGAATQRDPVISLLVAMIGERLDKEHVQHQQAPGVEGLSRCGALFVDHGGVVTCPDCKAAYSLWYNGHARCSFCNSAVDNGTHSAVLEHVLKCPRHPMRAVEAQLVEANERCARLDQAAQSLSIRLARADQYVEKMIANSPPAPIIVTGEGLDLSRVQHLEPGPIVVPAAVANLLEPIQLIDPVAPAAESLGAISFPSSCSLLGDEPHLRCTLSAGHEGKCDPIPF